MNERREENAPTGTEKQTNDSPKMNKGSGENATNKRTTGNLRRNERLEENAPTGNGKQRMNERLKEYDASAGTQKEISDERNIKERSEEGTKMNETKDENAPTGKNAPMGNQKQTAENSKMYERIEENAPMDNQNQTNSKPEMSRRLEENAPMGNQKQTNDNSRMNERVEENAQTGTRKQGTDNSKMVERFEENAPMGTRNQTTDSAKMSQRSERNAPTETQKQRTNYSNMSQRSKENAPTGTKNQTTEKAIIGQRSKENARTGTQNQRTDNSNMGGNFEGNAPTGTQTMDNPIMSQKREENTPSGTQKQDSVNPKWSQSAEENAPTHNPKTKEKSEESAPTGNQKENQKMSERREENAPGGTQKQDSDNPQRSQTVEEPTTQNTKTNEKSEESAPTGNRKENKKMSERREENAPNGTQKQTSDYPKRSQRVEEPTTQNPKANTKSEESAPKTTQRLDENAPYGPQKHSNPKTLERLEEDDRTALAGMSTSPPTRKPHSYSHCLRTNTGTHHKRPHQLRKHSLDENRILNHNPPNKNIAYFGGNQDSSEDEEFYPYSTVTANCGGGGGGPMGSMSDHHVNYKLGVDGGGDEKLPQQSLPEFMGTGGGIGIFKVPTRAPVNPNRPPCVELRPHPLRETQVGKFLRTIASTETQLWAGQESGVRVWNYSDSYMPGTGVGGRARRGDEDAAPFYESTTSTSPTICLVVDQGSKLVWSGHKDGKIRSWKMDQHFSDENGLKEGLCWQAHKAPVHTIEISPYGDIWSGSENGSIRVCPWEALEKCLSLSPEEKHMASLLMERSFIDLKNQATVNGVCNIPSSDVKCLLSDYARAKIWVVGSLYFSIWDARTRELLKVFNIEGQAENRGDTSSFSSQDQVVEDEMNVKFVSKSKREKSGGGFLQRSRNAIMGAADAVRRVATKGGYNNEDGKRTEAIVSAADGTIWSGSSNGLLVQWDGNGNRLHDFTHHPCGVLCFCSHGSRIWVGYVSGMVQLLDLEGNLIAGWIAHNGPVIKLVVGNGFVFSLATHGGIRAWNISSPAPVDNILRSELSEREIMYTRLENVRILVGTWNVGQGRASHDALMSWLGSTLSDVGVVVIGLQEVEMGAGFLAMSAAKETVGLEGSTIGQWWQDHIGKALDEGNTFERVGSRQLAGLMIAIWVRNSLRTHVGDLDVSAVACGLGRAIGNKGGVGLRLRVFDRIVCFVNCHLAAHLEAVNRRNADFDHIFRNMTFTRSSNLLNNAAAGVSSNAQMLRGQNATEKSPDDGKPDLAEADMVVFCGDFNYRLFGISYDEARDFVSQRSFDWLREKDQLRAEMKAGRVFQGMREALVRFPPTYKFERGKPGLGGYDSGEKKRIPAWCDRVLYRDNRAAPTEECSLECPMVASILQYEARMDVTESDHKPVRCKFNVDIAHVDRSIRRQEYGKILEANDTIKSNLEALRFVPETNVNTNKIVLQNQETLVLKLTNRSGEDMVFFHILCEGQSTINEDEVASDYRPRAALGFPRWLEVCPGAGMINPDQVADISVHHEEFHSSEEYVDGVPQSWWSEDTRDKDVVLLVNVSGSCSTDTKTHRIHVRHCFSGSSRSSTDQKPNAPACRIDKSNSSSSKHDSKFYSSNSKQDSKSNSSSGSKKHSGDSSVSKKHSGENSVSKKHSGNSHEKSKH